MKRKSLWVLGLCLVLMPVLAGQAEVKSKLDLDIYGYVKTDVVYQHGLGGSATQLGKALPANLYQYPSAGTADIRNADINSFSINSFQTRFGFLIKGPEDNGKWSRARIEADFYGKFPQYGSDYGVDYAFPKNADPEPNKGSIMLRRAYVEFGAKFWEILAGNEWMVVSPLAPHTNNYPAGADIGNLGYRMPQVRLTLNFMDKKLQLMVAADNKIGDPGSGDIDTGRASGKPTLEYGLFYTTKVKDSPLKIGFSGHNGVEGRLSKDGKWRGEEIDSSSYNLNWLVPIGSKINLSGEAFQGANLDGFFTGAQGNGWIYNPAGGGFQALKSQGGWAELMLSPLKKLDVIAGYGMDDINDDQLDHGKARIEMFADTGNKAVTKNEMYWGALNYKWNSAVMVSAEYMQVATEYALATPKECTKSGTAAPVDYDPGNVDRYTLAFWYMF